MRKAVILEAVWGHDYDLHHDQIYKRPCCPKCLAPIIKNADGKYACVSCGKVCSVDDKMLEWLKEREDIKVEYVDCHEVKKRKGTMAWLKSVDSVIMGCGGKKCMKVTYVKDPITLEWRTAMGVCEKCGARFIV